MKTMPHSPLVSLLCCVALASTVARAETSLASELDALVALDGAAYVQARDPILARGTALADACEPLNTVEAWQGTSFRRAILAGALAARVRLPELAQAIDHLDGIDPTHYLARRVPEPEVGRELAHLVRGEHGREALALVLETYFHLRDVVPTSTEGRDAERRALDEGLLFALERSADPSALGCLRFLATKGETLAARTAALRGLGAVAGTLVKDGDETTARTLIAELAAATTEPEPARRQAACQGLALVPSDAALAALSAALAAETSPEVRDTAITALGLFASPHAWLAHGPTLAPRGDTLRRQAVTTLVAAFNQPASPAERDRTAEAILTARHPVALELLDPNREGSAPLIARLRTKLARTESR